jgi:hypothetical protein
MIVQLTLITSYRQYQEDDILLDEQRFRLRDVLKAQFGKHYLSIDCTKYMNKQRKQKSVSVFYFQIELFVYQFSLFFCFSDNNCHQSIDKSGLLLKINIRKI